MKFSTETIQILKNFAKINANFSAETGSVIRTVSTDRSVYSVATIAESFEIPFAIYDLNEFLNVLAFFSNPDLTFHEDHVEIVDEDDPSIRTKYYYANAGLMEKVPTLKNISEAPDAVFTINATQYSRILKAFGLISCNDVKFVGEGDKINAVVYDSTKSNMNTFTIELMDNPEQKQFLYHVNQGRLVFIPGTYSCQVLMGRIIKATNTEKQIEYVIALDVD